jgi:hypothetical protein
MNIGSILLIIGILVLLYIVVRYLVNDVNTLSGIQTGTTMQTIEASSLAKDSSGTNQSNFAYSIWFNIDDWNYRYGEPKVIFGRMGHSTSSSTTTTDTTTTTTTEVSGVSGLDPCPIVVLGPIQNNLNISLAVFPSSDDATSDDIKTANGSVIHTCNVANIPIQKWVNLLVSVYGKTLDVYIDGKLVKTCVLPGTAKINQDASVYVTPKGGFAGWTAKFQYYPNAMDPQGAWNIYKKGYGESWLSSIFGKYQIKVSFMENGTENNSFTI